MPDQFPDKRSSTKTIADFLRKADALPARRDQAAQRLIFSLDATASRQASWNRARELHANMFEVSKGLNGLQVQLCYYRGIGEFYSSPWGSSAGLLHDQMASVECRGGYTQIRALLQHALRESRQTPVRALIFIGDALEESVDELCGLAGECGLRKLPLFIFQEGNNADVATVFRRLSTLSGGAYAHFDSNSANQLADLLRAVAAYVSGGVDALRELQDNAARLILEQL
ncbi:MAG: hypothetical protein ACI9G5_002072 [Paracoccaceae bacterium]